jgi:hypothetical protein
MLTQALLDDIARQAFAIKGALVEQVTVQHRTSATGAFRPVGPLRAIVSLPATEVMTMAALLASDDTTRARHSDVHLRLATADVGYTPTLYDEVVRGDGTRWRVLDLAGGPGRPFWQFTIRKVTA